MHGSVLRWRRDRAGVHAASLAFYSAFALAPLVMFAAAVSSLYAGPFESRRFMLDLLRTLFGDGGTEAVRPMIDNAGELQRGAWATLISFATLLYGASTLFVELQDSLNVIFAAPERRRGWFRRALKRRLLSFGLVATIPLIVLAGPAWSAALGFLGRSQFGSIALSLAVQTALFAFIFKVMPDTPVPWRDVWPGSAFTAALFTLGQTLLGLYLTRVAARSVYGAAGSLVALLLWIHVSAQILLFGAEFVQEYRKLYRDAAACPL